MAERRGDQAAGLRRIFSGERLRVVAFVSGGPGAGKSLIVANLAACLAQRGKSVLMIDENAGRQNLAACFGAAARGDLADVIDGGLPMNEALLRVAPGVQLLAAAGAVGQLGHLSEAQGRALLAAFGALDEPPDAVLVDASPDHPLGFSPLGLAAQDAVIVVSPAPASITGAYALIKKVSLTYARRNYRVLVNGAPGERQARAVFGNIARVAHGRRFARLEYAGAVPFDEHLRRAALLCQPVGALYPDAPAAAACRALAAELPEWRSPEAEDDAPGGLEQFALRLLNLSRLLEPAAIYA
ncbi:MAG: AAA family ATPase [Candidatus Accumulibacter sp.]|nr:AAA family ATPase [Accumulibacter sp.]